MKSHSRAELDHRAAATILIVATVLLYVSSLSFGFISDDHDQVESVAPSSLTLKQTFTGAIADNYYRPVFRIYLAAVSRVAAGQPAVWHAFSILAHAVVVLLAYALCITISMERRWALLVGLIMALHPVHVESVAWISGVTDPIYSTFFLGAVIAYIQWRNKAQRRWLTMTLICSVLALLSKETAVMLVPTLLLVEFTVFKARSLGRRAAWSLLAVIAAFEVIYLVARHAVLHGFSHNWNDMSILQMVLTWPKVLMLYAKHLVWPFALSFYYDIEPVSRIGDPAFYIYAIALLVLLVVVGVFAYRHRSRLLLLALLWIPLLLAPVLYLRIYNFGEFAHDRYLYLPLLGFAMLVAFALSKLPDSDRRLFGYTLQQFVAIVTIVLTLGTASYAQSLYYRSDLLLFYRAVNLQPNSDGALNNLGSQLFQRGMLKQALEFFRRAAERNPNSWRIQYNYALALERAQRLDESAARYIKALSCKNASPMVWIRYASMELSRGNVIAAQQILEQGISEMPKEPMLHFNLGAVLERVGKNDAAVTQYERTLQLDAHNQYATQALARLGKLTN